MAEKKPEDLTSSTAHGTLQMGEKLRGYSDQLTLTRTRNRETSRPRYVIMAVPNNMAQAIWPPERAAPTMMRLRAREGVWAKDERGRSNKRGAVQEKCVLCNIWM